MVRTGRFAWALIPGANTSCGDRPSRRRCWQRRMRDGKAITQWCGTRPEGSGTADKQPRSDVRGELRPRREQGRCSRAGSFTKAGAFVKQRTNLHRPARSELRRYPVWNRSGTHGRCRPVPNYGKHHRAYASGPALHRRPRNITTKCAGLIYTWGKVRG